MKFLILAVVVSALTFACASGEGDPLPPDEQQCGNTTSTGNCFAEVALPSNDASTETTPLR